VNLYTRCPACQTVFRVTTRELQLSSGRVRCGQCHEVFDAFASLTAQEPEPASAAPAAAQAVAPPPGSRQAETQDVPPPTGAPARPARPDPAASLYEWEFRMPPQQSRRWLWASLSVLLLTSVAAQAAVGFRDEILAAWPQSRPLYEKACQWIGCRVGLPRLARQLHVEASDLQTVTSARPNQIELTVLVRNRAPVPVEYPAFELTLTSAQDQVLARRVFLPAEYLGEAPAIGSGMPANGEVPIRLFLDTGRIAASGYRLYFFYP
jgi:predicted Zn finger-like uncharacterized protein